MNGKNNVILTFGLLDRGSVKYPPISNCLFSRVGLFLRKYGRQNIK